MRCSILIRAKVRLRPEDNERFSTWQTKTKLHRRGCSFDRFVFLWVHLKHFINIILSPLDSQHVQY